MYYLHPSSLFLYFLYVFSCNVIIRAYVFVIFKLVNHLFKCSASRLFFFSYNPRLSLLEENHIILLCLIIGSVFFVQNFPTSLCSTEIE